MVMDISGNPGTKYVIGFMMMSEFYDMESEQ